MNVIERQMWLARNTGAAVLMVSMCFEDGCFTREHSFIGVDLREYTLWVVAAASVQTDRMWLGSMAGLFHSAEEWFDIGSAVVCMADQIEGRLKHASALSGLDFVARVREIALEK